MIQADMNKSIRAVVLLSMLFLLVIHCSTPTEPDENDEVGEMTFTSTTVKDHNHKFSLLRSEIDFPIPGGISRNSSLDDNHVHSVGLTQSELLLLKKGGEVVINDNPLGGHGHSYTLSKWYR